jgi:hypothetical protein
MSEEKTYSKVVVLTKPKTTPGTHYTSTIALTTSHTYDDATVQLSGDYLIISEEEGDGTVYTNIPLSIVDSYKVFN